MSAHASVWLATTDRPSYPPLVTDLDVDVVVVGGGITGLTTALLVQREGGRVAVVEARRIGDGTTGNTTGKVTSQHTLTYASLVQRLGTDRARQYADANQQAIETVAELVAATSADCDLERAPAYVYTTSADRCADLTAEHEAAVELGLPAVLTDEIDLPFPVELALRFDDQAHLHAGKYLAALSRAFVERGGIVFEGTRALGVDEEGDRVTVRTEHGDVTADHAVVATLLPFVDRGGYFARARATRSYGVAARLRSGAPTGMHISLDEPSRSTRPWIDGTRRGLVVVGEGHPTGEGEATPARWGELESWAREHFDVESFEYRWSAQDYVSVDDVPYVGRSPLMSCTFVATGFKKWGLTNGTAAASIIAAAIAGREHPHAEVFDSRRLGGTRAVVGMVEQNVHVGARFVVDRVSRLRAPSFTHLQPGEGGMVQIEGHAVGGYRDAEGTLHAVSITCTHMGCTLHWNGAERSWDCPCHGSRFDAGGDVLEGPAVKPLERIDVDELT